MIGSESMLAAQIFSPQGSYTVFNYLGLFTHPGEYYDVYDVLILLIFLFLLLKLLPL
jgi:hypothetical protein